jgi:hypothetical protein
MVMVYANNFNATYSSDGADKVSLHKKVSGYYAGKSLYFKYQDIIYNVTHSNNHAQKQTLINLANQIID